MSRVFIGSSSESIYLANALFSNLDQTGKFEVTPWYNGGFEGGEYTLEALNRYLDSSDFGVFILNTDDIVLSRGIVQATVRDNVLFELGLFMGRLGKNRVFFVTPRELSQGDTQLEILVPVDESECHTARRYVDKGGKKFEKKVINSFKTPSDLYGIAPLQYGLRTDGNWKAALTDVSAQLCEKFSRLGEKENPQNDINELASNIYQLTEELDTLMESYCELERLYLFISEAKKIPRLIENEDFDLLLEALDSGINKGEFKLKGITLFKLEGDNMIQCGRFKDVGQHGKMFSLKYNHSQQYKKVNVIEAYKSGEIIISEKYPRREYLVSVPFINNYVVTFHYHHTIKVKNPIEELHNLIRIEDPVFRELEKFFSKTFIKYVTVPLVKGE
ncbi:TIR domain-containing protein [Priestia megaterium]